MSEDSWKQNIRKTMKQHIPNISDDEIDSFDESSEYWGSGNYKSAANWIARTIDIVKQTDQFSNEIIFTNLCGLLSDTELRKFLNERVAIFKDLRIEGDDKTQEFINNFQDISAREHLQSVLKIFTLIELICDDFDDDQKFLLGFIRHRSCHPTLNNYLVKLNRTEGIQTKRWDRLKKLGTLNKENDFKTTLIDKLKKHMSNLEDLQRLFVLLSK